MNGCKLQPRNFYQDEFLRPGVLFRKNLSHGHLKAGGEPHVWSSGSNIAFSASIMTSILDEQKGLGNSGLSSDFVSGCRFCSDSKEPESLDERKLKLNAFDTRRDIDEGMTVVVSEKRGGVGRSGRNESRDLTKSKSL